MPGFRAVLAKAWQSHVRPYYEAHALSFPSEATRRLWYVRSARTGGTFRVHAANEEALAHAILDLQPLRISYGVRPLDDPHTFFETPFFPGDVAAAVQTRRILLEDFGIPPSGVRVSGCAGQRIQLVAGAPPFAGASLPLLRRLMTYFSPEGFQPQDTETGPGRRYHGAIASTLAAWAAMDPVQLALHLAARTPLGDDAKRIHRFLAQTKRPEQHLNQVPRLQRFLHGKGLEAAFPTLNVDRTLTSPRLLLPGSFDYFLGATVNPVRDSGASA